MMGTRATPKLTSRSNYFIVNIQLDHPHGSDNMEQTSVT